MTGLEAITDKEYLGRMIIIGKSPEGQEVIAYAVTGRSPPSRARKLITADDGTIKTDVTDPKQLEEGNPNLLIYNCIARFQDIFVVSNGAQTDLILDTAAMTRDKNSLGILLEASRQPYLVEGDKPGELIDLTSYEPDSMKTPRISGVITRPGAVLSIVKHTDAGPARSYFEIPLENGKAKVIATYTGKNEPKGVRVPSFQGEPLDVRIFEATPEQFAHEVYEALGPKQGEQYLQPGDDFRVGVAAVFFDRKANWIYSYIINKTGDQQ